MYFCKVVSSSSTLVTGTKKVHVKVVAVTLNKFSVWYKVICFFRKNRANVMNEHSRLGNFFAWN